MDTGLDSLKTAFEKVFHKTGEFIGNKIPHKIVKSKHVIDGNPRNVEEYNYSTRKKRRNIKRIRTIIVKMERCKIFKLLNDSTVSKFTTKN